MEWKFQLGLVKPWGNFSSVYRNEIFAYNHNSIFTLLRLTYEMKSHHGLTNWNFNYGWNSPPYNWPPNMELFAKIISNVRKRLHLRCLTGFWKCLCCVREFSYTTFFVAFLFVVIQNFFYFSNFPWNSYTCTLATKSYWKGWRHLPICSYILERQKS